MRPENPRVVTVEAGGVRPPNSHANPTSLFRRGEVAPVDDENRSVLAELPAGLPVTADSSA